jgi:hypothetical protein
MTCSLVELYKIARRHIAAVVFLIFIATIASDLALTPFLLELWACYSRGTLYHYQTERLIGL